MQTSIDITYFTMKLHNYYHVILNHFTRTLKKEKSWSAGSVEKESPILDAINDVNQNSTFGCRNGFKFRVKQSMK